MSIKEYVAELRARKEEQETALNKMRAERDALIAKHAEYHAQEQALAKKIKEAQLRLAPILNELAEIRKEAKAA